MKKKIVGILVCTLLIAATVIPVAGIMNNKKENIGNTIAITSTRSIPDEFIITLINYSIEYFGNNGNPANPFDQPNEIDYLGPPSYDISEVDGRVFDCNLDCDFDVLIDTGNWNSGFHELRVYRNDITDFALQCTVSLPPKSNDFYDRSRVVVGDFSEDGFYDIIQLDILTSTFTGYENNMQCYFEQPIELNLSTSWLGSGYHAYDMEAADFNKDGHCDLLVNGYDSFSGANGIAALYLGSGGWVFSTPTIVITLSVQPTPSIMTGDFNDTTVCSVDVIIGLDDDVDPGQAYLFDGSGTGTFTIGSPDFPPTPGNNNPFDTNTIDEWWTENHPGGGEMDAYDFDKDGELDTVDSCVVSLTYPIHQLEYRKGNGAGVFGPLVIVHEYARLIAAPEDQIKPTLQITKPINSIYFDDLAFNIPFIFPVIIRLPNSRFTINALSDDIKCNGDNPWDFGLAGVELFIDNVFQGTAFFNAVGAVYSFTWTIPPRFKIHNIQLYAYDNAGNRELANKMVLVLF